MKITIWIRAAEKSPRKVTLRTDAKYESNDTPKICTFGNALLKAIERGAEGETVKVEDPA